MLSLLTTFLVFTSFASDPPALPSKKSITALIPDTNYQDSIVQLGDSRYYIILPGDFKITEARGKEGQLGYNILPKDPTISGTMGFIEIEKGFPIGGHIESTGTKEYLAADFLGKKIMWAIEVTETARFIGQTPPGNISAWATAKEKSDVVRLIRICSTLTRK
jgi:hypothetical protein